MRKHRLSFLVAAVLAACSGPAGSALSSAPSSTLRAPATPNDFSLHPPRMHFSSPQDHYKVEHVRGFGENGAIGENCIKKGVAEVAGAGLHGDTLVADVIPMATGHCEATFTNGSGLKLRLPVTVGP